MKSANSVNPVKFAKLVKFKPSLLASGFALVLSLGLSFHGVMAADLAPTALSPDHPLIGNWRIDVPNGSCREIHQIAANGTTRVSSGEQRTQTVFDLSARPSAKGFYKWTDQVVKDNGKPDCLGTITQPGHTETNYILLQPTGAGFMMCEEEDAKTCFGPFVRHEGN